MGKPSDTGRKEMPCGKAQGAANDILISNNDAWKRLHVGKQSIFAVLRMT